MIFLSLTNEFGEVEEIQLLFSQLQWKSQVQASKENFIGGSVDRSLSLRNKLLDSRNGVLDGTMHTLT